ncbi:unnamed protein product [Urochloa decumbens]|uniref:Uncharacterized protein n=1 Tax=Urochloa decumbens TaxID=240449 RepID=A0ABC9E1T3_9POAL
MAEHRGAAAARNHPPEQPIEPAIDAFANPDHRGRAQRLCLDAGRALALCGVLVVATRPADDTTLIVIACFVGFLLWVLGACLCLLALTPAAPRAARAAAASASTVLRCLSPLMN